MRRPSGWWSEDNAMRTFPILVSFDGKPPLVVGGGELAAVKARPLLKRAAKGGRASCGRGGRAGRGEGAASVEARGKRRRRCRRSGARACCPRRAEAGIASPGA